ncbi:unnamed protein product [Orchesella dallaii]|uniref:Peptidase S1 domain-containing protein n=1 Tax=Orchesella dallaii TaxID=48710 RepID=A0ABP1RVK8_9HEXA
MDNYIILLLLGSFTLVTSYKIEAQTISENKTLNTRIIGGTPASEGSFPYQILLEQAEVDRYKVSGNEQIRRVTRIISHPGFSYRNLANDIALLAIDEPFQVNKFVSRIPLPKQGQKTTGEVIVTGWGLTSRAVQAASRFLQQVRLTILSDNACRLLYLLPPRRIHSSMLCTGKLVGGKDSCDGDSGGPLKAVDGNYLAGIVSWGTICAFPLQPGVNTEVSHFIEWIEQEAKTAF